jgi:GNAT superfamily N-acetyltransferase
VNQISIIPCNFAYSPYILLLLESHGESFPYMLMRDIVHKVNKALDENPTEPPLFIAIHEGHVVGFVGMERDREDYMQFHLFAQAVKRGYQGQGIGKKLLSHAAGKSLLLGGSSLLVSLYPSFSPATRHFFVNQGFKPVFDESYAGDTSHEIYRFAKMLQRAAAPIASPNYL